MKDGSVAVIDPRDNKVVADIPVGGYPGPIAADDEFVCVCNIGDATVTRILARTRARWDTESFSRAIDLLAADGHLGPRTAAPRGIHRSGCRPAHSSTTDRGRPGRRSGSAPT